MGARLSQRASPRRLAGQRGATGQRGGEAFGAARPERSARAAWGEAMSGFVSLYTVTPSGAMTRPNDTVAYAQGDLIASSTTAGSIVVPSVQAARPPLSSGSIIRARLFTAVASGWDAAAFTVRLWRSAPTYVNGDNGTYAVATGASGFLGALAITLTQGGDGAFGAGAPTIGNAIVFELPQGQQKIYWDLQYTGAAALTPAASQQFTLTLEVVQA
jgi:hypothetical protein